MLATLWMSRVLYFYDMGEEYNCEWTEIWDIETISNIDDIENVEDCDCQTVVSDIGLNNLNKDWEPICDNLLIRFMFVSIRWGTLERIRDILNENGILYIIIQSRMDDLREILWMLYDLNVKYDCGWPEPPY
jgi:hypothetical protein